MKYQRKISKNDMAYCLMWAKKIKAINILGGKCSLCGNNNIFSLAFHHLNKDEKEFTFNSLRSLRWSIIAEEIKKCILLCENCHRELHSSGSTRRKEDKYKLLSIKNKFACEKCNYVGEKTYASLVFHHVRDKKFQLNTSRISLSDITDEMIKEELKKCIVLCSNCHAIKHVNIKKFNKFRNIINEKINSYTEIPEKIDRDILWDMYFNKKMRQIDIVRVLGCSKGTVSQAIKDLCLKNGHERPKREVTIHKKQCPQCEKFFKTNRRTKIHCSDICYREYLKTPNRPSKEELIIMKKNMSYGEIAKMYNVSRTAVYKWMM